MSEIPADVARALLRADGAISHYKNALGMHGLGRIKDGKTLFEGSPTKDTDCLLAWQNLDSAGKKASLAQDELRAVIAKYAITSSSY